MIDISIEEFSIDVHKTYDLLIAILENRDYTIEHLAKEFKITKVTIHNYNKGRSVPTLNIIDGLCRLVTGDGYYTLLALKGLEKASFAPDFGKRCMKLRLDNKLKGSDVYRPLYSNNTQISNFETGKKPMSIRLFYCYWRMFNNKMPFDVLYRTLVKRNIITNNQNISNRTNMIRDNKSDTIDTNNIEYDIIRTGMLLQNIRISRGISYNDIIKKCPIYPNQISKIESSLSNILIDTYLKYIHAIMGVNLFQYIGLLNLDTPDLNTALRQYRVDHKVTIKDIEKCGMRPSTTYRIEEHSCMVTFKHIWYYVKAIEGRTIREMLIDKLQNDMNGDSATIIRIGKEDV